MKKGMFTLLLVVALLGASLMPTSRSSLAAQPAVNYLVSGTVSGPLGALAGVTVSAGLGHPSTQTDVNGHYQLSLPAGLYTITTPLTGTCYLPGLAIVTLPPSRQVDFHLTARLAGGYFCDDFSHQPYIAATIPITNFTDLDNGTAPLTLPFDFTYFGITYTAGSTIHVSTNGNLQFVGADPSPWHQHIPNPAPPNTAIYGLGADLTLAGGASRPGQPLSSGVYAIETGESDSGNAKFAVEWRNVAVVGGGTVSFEIVLEQGSNNVYVNYGALNILATLLFSVEGIENADGTAAFEYNYLQGLLNNLLGNITVLYYTTPAATPTATPTATSTPTLTPTLTFTPTPTPPGALCPLPFSDLDGSPFINAIQHLYCGGVVNGTDATHYSPALNTTRAQFAKVVTLGFGLGSYTPTGQPDFSDVPASYYAYPFIEAGYHAAILNGYDTLTCTAAGATPPCYLPGRVVTRAQVAKLVVGAAGYLAYTPANPSFSDVSSQSVFYSSIETAHYHGIVGGYSDGSFHPNNPVRRDEMAQMVYKGTTTP